MIFILYDCIGKPLH